MPNYDKTKNYDNTNTYPVHAKGTSGLLKRVEPLLTPALFKSRHLKGILELAKRFGITYTDIELKDRINLAINQAELELGVPIFAEQFQEKHALDWNLYREFIHIRAEQGPIISIEQLAIVSSNQLDLFTIPAEWIEAANFHQRQINVIPILGLYGTNSVGQDAAVAAGGVFLTVVRGFQWVPAYWQIKYTAGVCKDPGHVPVSMNSLIGAIAAMDILSSIAPSNAQNSVSLSQDGIGQSSSGPGPQIFQLRMAELEQQKRTLLGQFKRVFSSKYFISNI